MYSFHFSMPYIWTLHLVAIFCFFGTAQAEERGASLDTSTLLNTHATDALAKKGDAPNPGAAPNVRTIAVEAPQNCWLTVANKYNIPTYLLFAIAMVESELNPTAINKNTNSSIDYGYMQINDWWYPTLKTYGIAAKDLGNPCVSIHVGAWILADNFYRMGYSWRAIGAYNARDDYKRWVYAQKVYAMHDMLVKWSDTYHKTYLDKFGISPPHVPKPPEPWIKYAKTNASVMIKTGGRGK